MLIGWADGVCDVGLIGYVDRSVNMRGVLIWCVMMC